MSNEPYYSPLPGDALPPGTEELFAQLPKTRAELHALGLPDWRAGLVALFKAGRLHVEPAPNWRKRNPDMTSTVKYLTVMRWNSETDKSISLEEDQLLILCDGDGITKNEGITEHELDDMLCYGQQGLLHGHTLYRDMLDTWRATMEKLIEKGWIVREPCTNGLAATLNKMNLQQTE
jgi:hypothetical protein